MTTIDVKLLDTYHGHDLVLAAGDKFRLSCLSSGTVEPGEVVRVFWMRNLNRPTPPYLYRIMRVDDRIPQDHDGIIHGHVGYARVVRITRSFVNDHDFDEKGIHYLEPPTRTPSEAEYEFIGNELPERE